MRFVALIMALTVTSTASAQNMDSENTRKTMQSFGRCVVNKNIDYVEEYLQHPDREMKDGLSFQLSICRISAGAGFLKGEARAFRYALAEAYLIKKFRGSVPSLSGFPEKLDASTDPMVILGTCMVQKSPYESWQLLRTGAASRREHIAFTALMPTMKFCVSQGSTIRLNKFFVRGAIADAFFRYSRTAELSQGATS